MQKKIEVRIICMFLACFLFLPQIVYAQETESKVMDNVKRFFFPLIDVVMDGAESNLQQVERLVKTLEFIAEDREEKREQSDHGSFGEKDIFQQFEEFKGNYDDLTIPAGTTQEQLFLMTMEEYIGAHAFDKLIGDDLIGKGLENALGENNIVNILYNGANKIWDVIDGAKEAWDTLWSGDKDVFLQFGLSVGDVVADVIKPKDLGLNGVSLTTEIWDFFSIYANTTMRTAEYKEFVEDNDGLFMTAFVASGIEGLIDIYSEVPEQTGRLLDVIVDHLQNKEDGLSFIERLVRQIKPTSQVNVYKPNIYLYADHELNASVEFEHEELLMVSIPEYSLGWHVKVQENGLLSCQNSTYDFLFYESLASKALAETDYGWLIEAEHREEQLLQVLQQYDFNEKEIADFMEFWTEKLEADVDYLMYPQGTEAVDKQMPITINPSPDKITRIWFAFEVYHGQVLEEPKIERIEREGFTVVEWGGFFLN